MVEMTFLKILMLTRQVHQKSVLFVTTVTFLDKGFMFQSSASNCFHDASMIYMNLKDIAILNIGDVDYCRFIIGISQCEAVNLLENTDLSKRSGSF